MEEDKSNIGMTVVELNAAREGGPSRVFIQQPFRYIRLWPEPKDTNADVVSGGASTGHDNGSGGAAAAAGAAGHCKGGGGAAAAAGDDGYKPVQPRRGRRAASGDKNSV